MNSKKVKSSSKERGRLPIHVYLAYLLVCTFLLTGVSFSRYTTTSTADDGARVAKGAVSVSYDTSPEGTALRMDYESDNVYMMASFPFQVSNDSSEVAIRYDVVITLDKPLLPQIAMMMDGTDSLSQVSDTEYVFENAGTFEAGESPPNSHLLMFSCDPTSVPKKTYASYDITISIRSQQID